MESEDSQSDNNSQEEEDETYQNLLKANEKRYMRLFKTLSAKKYPRQRKDMAKIMAATFAAAEVAQIKHGTVKRLDGSNTSQAEL